MRMDLAARRVTVDGGEVQLANKEFELLRVLIQRAGQVVHPRRDPVARSGTTRTSRRSKTLDMHMSWLRRKLGDGGSAERRIATVRGVGFRFNTAD